MGLEDYINRASDRGWIADHRALYESDPEAAHLWDTAAAGGDAGVVPTCLLTTVGRRTGKVSVMPLIYGSFGGDDVILVASKGGVAKHPGWFHNLMAQDTVTVQIASRAFDATARVAEGDERAELWAKMAELYPPYDDYQARTERQIPVVVLTPV